MLISNSSCISFENSDCFQSCYWSKCFCVVNSFLLTVALCNKSGFVSDYFTLFIQLVPEHPFCSNNVLLWWSCNQIPHIIPLELIKLFLHCNNPSII